jgi:predicted nucleic acid-binding protein
MTILYDEEGTEQVRELLRGQDPVFIPFLALMEVQYKLLRGRPEAVDDAMAMIGDWPIQAIESNPEWREMAAAVKAAGRLSVVDAWVAALALLLDAALVHKDPEFDEVDGLKQERLPYKRARA